MTPVITASWATASLRKAALTLIYYFIYWSFEKLLKIFLFSFYFSAVFIENTLHYSMLHSLSLQKRASIAVTAGNWKFSFCFTHLHSIVDNWQYWINSQLSLCLVMWLINIYVLASFSFPWILSYSDKVVSGNLIADISFI